MAELSIQESLRLPWLRILAEGVLIVVSILLAFAIDAWWSARQVAAEQRALEDALRVELAATLPQVESARAQALELTERSREFLAATSDLSAYPLDSIQALVMSAFIPVRFEASMPAYAGAIQSGELAKLGNLELFDALSRFQLNRKQVSLLSQRNADVFLGGWVLALAEEVGSVYAIHGPTAMSSAPDRFKMSDPEYREWVQLPHVYARVENAMVLRANLESGLAEMAQALTDALVALGETR